LSKKQQHEVETLGNKALSELEGDADKIAGQLWGKRPPDMASMSEAEYLAFVQRHWPDANFRNSLLIRVGPKNFLETYADAFGLDREAVLSEWLPAPTAAAPNGGMM
jgi:hypothetical protein